MQPLPKWVLPPTMPSIYEAESFTALEAVARVYGATKQLIDEYNEFAAALQAEVDGFEATSSAEIESFKKAMEKRLACKFNDLDAAYAEMKAGLAGYADGKISSIYEQYLGEYVSQKTSEIVNEKIASGDIAITLVYDPDTESLTMAAGEG